MVSHDPLRTAFEIREQLASEKRRLVFFFGAGTSMSVGIPGIKDLTDKVGEQLQEPFKACFASIRKELGSSSNVEQVLDRIRIYVELARSDDKRDIHGLKGTQVPELDSHVCRKISELVGGNPAKGTKAHVILAQWLRALHSCREWPVEIFTTNYDLVFENAMELVGLPFFDGFVGAVAPFFVPESVEEGSGAVDQLSCPPRAWTRLWKLHGSINWRMQKREQGTRSVITRLSGSTTNVGEELVIFPSREKYAQSRKLPFLAYQDRMRKVLSGGERLLIVAGYSFSDEHVNDVLFQALRSNPRLAITACVYDKLADNLTQFGIEHRNLSIYARDKACIGGVVSPWGEPSRKKKEAEEWSFWDDKEKAFTLGDFASFAAFLERFVGFHQHPSGEALQEEPKA